jgi:hypothetical protein
MGLAASMLKSSLRTRLAVRRERQLSQTEFLLEAGIQRAVSKLRADPDYSEETWRLDEATIPGYSSALVEISVTAGNEGGDKDVQIVVQLPADSPLSIQRTYKFTISETDPSNEE